MPRTKPLSSHEREICSRLRQWRNLLNLQLAFVADMLKVKASYLANIETGRAPVRYSLVFAFAQTRSINVHWLYHGGGFPFERTLAPNPAVLGVSESELFSVVYFTFLRHQMNELGSYVPGGVLGREMARYWLDLHASRWLASLPEQHLDSFVSNVVRAGDGYTATYPHSSDAQIEERLQDMAALRAVDLAAAVKHQENFSLQILRSDVTFSEVHKLSLESVLSDVRKRSSVRGAKASLAKYVGVPPTRVSEWLSGTHEPSAENVLKLVNWICDPSQHQNPTKQNAPASATNTREGEQTRKGNDEKSKTGPPRKR